MTFFCNSRSSLASVAQCRPTDDGDHASDHVHLRQESALHALREEEGRVAKEENLPLFTPDFSLC